MSTPEAKPPEKPLWSESVSQWHYGSKCIFIILLIAALAGTFFVNLRIEQLIVWGIRGALALVSCCTLLWIYLDRRSRKYTVTNRRVSVEFGIVSKESNEVRIQDIRSINLTTKGLLGLLGIGRVEFASAAADDAEVVFWNVPGAAKIRDMVRSLQA